PAAFRLHQCISRGQITDIGNRLDTQLRGRLAPFLAAQRIEKNALVSDWDRSVRVTCVFAHDWASFFGCAAKNPKRAVSTTSYPAVPNHGRNTRASADRRAKSTHDDADP